MISDIEFVPEFAVAAAFAVTLEPVVVELVVLALLPDPVESVIKVTEKPRRFLSSSPIL